MAENTLDVRLLHAYKSESEWNSSNPILKLGETGYVSDADTPNYGRYKIGDGSTAWKSLPWGDKGIWDAYNGIEIGGRNYFSSKKQKTFNADNEYTLDNYNNTGSFTQFYNLTKPMSYFSGKNMVLSFDAISPNGISEMRVYNINDGPRYRLFCNGSDYILVTSSLDSSWKHFDIYCEVVDQGSGYSDQASNKIEFFCPDQIGCKIRNVKFEIGNKATDWTPAPEDKADVSHTHSASDITSGTLSTSLLPTIPVSKGGTGLTSITSGQVLIGNGTGNITTRAIDTTTGGTSGSTSLITSGAVYSGLAGKANTHDHPYLKLDGSSQMTGDLKFTGVPSLYWNDGTWQQRIAITDDSTADTAVFSFQQSSNSGSNFTDLMVIRDNGKVIANTFVGSLSGNASTATTASNLKGFTNTTTSGTAIDSAITNGVYYVTGTSGILGQNDGSAFVQGYNSSWVTQIYQDYRTGQIALRGKNNGTWQSWRKVLDSVNYTSYAAPNSGSLNYVRVYNSSSVGSVDNLSLNDLAKQHYAVGMVNNATDNPLGSKKWVHAISMAWGNNNNSNWISQIALGVENSDGMWYRTTQGAITGTSWKRVLDSSNYTSYTVTKTGSGASGTWGINISGNSATSTTSAKLGRSGDTSAPMTFYWSGQSGQPTWLWGGNDGSNMYVYNPSNFSVNHAVSANYLSTYASNGSNNLEALQNIFDTVPKSVATAVRLQHSSHSMAFGWFLDGYGKSNAYGGWFVSDYGTPTWVGVDNGSWTTSNFLTSSNYSSYALPLSGGTMTGALNFANGTWNTMGDDAYIGDCNQAGRIGIKGKNGATGIYFANYSGGTDQEIFINGAGTMTITGTVASTFKGNLSGNASGLSYYSIDNNLTVAQAKDQIRSKLTNKGIAAAVLSSSYINQWNTNTASYYDSSVHSVIALNPGYDNTTYGHFLVAHYGDRDLCHIGVDGGHWGSLRTLLDSVNYTSYTVTKTGGGASGTWNININGNASSATNADKLDGYHESSFLRYSGWWSGGSGQNINDASGMVFAYSDHGLPGSWGIVTTFDYSKDSSYRHQIYGDGWNNEMYFRTRSSDRGGWNAWRHLLDDVNYRGILDGSYVKKSGDTMTGNLTAPSIYTSNWFRSTGATGWYSETYGGGWYMSDSDWIRSYGSKNIYQNAGVLRTDGTLQVGENGKYFSASSSGTTIGNDVTISGTLVLSKTTDASGTADNGPALVVGGTRSQAHLEIDANEIIAKSDATTKSNLYLGENGIAIVFNGTPVVKTNSYGTSLPSTGVTGQIFFKVI